MTPTSEPAEITTASFEYDMERAAAILAELMATPLELRLNTAAVAFRIITEASGVPFPLLPVGHWAMRRQS